eukprot:5363841-Amphidinium_carterae.1
MAGFCIAEYVFVATSFAALANGLRIYVAAGIYSCFAMTREGGRVCWPPVCSRPQYQHLCRAYTVFEPVLLYFVGFA